MTTKRQKQAVLFCEEWLDDVSFNGDINNNVEVSNFLSLHLEDAKSEYNHAYELYSDEAIYRDMAMEYYD